jgi:glycerol-1-phosphate dehydrogenase [NAD(P)+]
MTGTDLIQDLVAGDRCDPDTGERLDVKVKAVVIAESLAGSEGDLVCDLAMGGRLAIVSDPETHAALAARVERAVEARVAVDRIRLPSRPHADDRTVAALRERGRLADGYVAVGSGTINDLCKHAAALDGKPYAVFATAPSMNGYASVNAAITVDGHKRSLAAQAPLAVFMDLGVLAKAPRALIRAGFGDSLCRSTAQSDWLLSHLLLDTPYRAVPFDLLAEDEARLLAEPRALVSGSPAAILPLARTLILSGFGMTLCGGSYPASQGEHLIGHTIEMMPPPAWPGALHGALIAVTTLTMARLQARMLGGPAPVLRPTALDRDAVVRHFGPEVGQSCWGELALKALTPRRAAALNDRLQARWEDMRAALAAVAILPQRLGQAARVAGAPTRCADLGLDEAYYRTAVTRAREIRNRFTFLDLALDAEGFDPSALV